MATLFNTKISATYPGLIKTTDNAAISATLKQLTDGSGNTTGLYVNNAGDFKVTAILEWGSLKDTGTGVTITQFVTAANGIANFNNDTTVPTSAAVKTYVDAVVTASDLDFLGDSNTGSPAVDLDSQNFSVLGTTNEIVTSGANQTLTIGLPNSVTISGTFTGATFSGDLSGTINTATTATTQSAGDNSTKVATTAYVDSLDAASDLDFSGDSGTGDVTLNTQVLAITGTTNQIVTAASGQGLSLSLPTTVHRNLQGNVTGNVTGDLTGNVTATSVLANGVTATTQSSSDDSTKVATTAYVKGLNNASDLDFTTDSGNGAVVLNTETLSVLGTTNQINSAGSGQAITLSLPSTVHRNLQGNVTGDLTGNADTATKWQTARDLSLTGQATGTISSVDGSLNVSGAVTLDNNSVTGKVLTGLPTPASATVLATDSILEGFGKLQSQINGLANGLQFQGAWNATTNSPVLSSGGGEATTGTTTSTTANKLVDSSASFTSTVTVGDKVINQVDRQTALVSNIDSDTILSLDADIMLTGEAYTIDNSPFISQGHYYVVSVGGTTSLNGINTWSVGDWVIAGATNVWEKLDHTDVEGTGTPGNIAKWSATGVIADSIISESGAAITVTGSLSTTTNLNSGSNFAVNTDKFTANATSGNVAFSGDLAINTNKFTVNATSGNTLVAGTITSPTFLGDLNGTINTLTTAVTQSANNNSTKVATTAYVDTSAGLYLPLAGGTLTGNLIGTTATFVGTVTGKLSNIAGLQNMFNIQNATNTSTLASFGLNLSNDQLILGSDFAASFLLKTGGTTAITIDTSQNSTFAGDVIIDDSVGRLTLDSISGANRIMSTTTGFAAYETLQFRAENYEFQIAATTKFSIDGSGNSTFAGNVNTGRLFVEQSGADIIDMTRTGVGTYRFAISGSDSFSLFDVGANADRLVIDSSGKVSVGICTGNLKEFNVKNQGSNGGLRIEHSGSANTVAFLGQGGSGDEGVLFLQDSGVDTVKIAGENGLDSFINSGNVGIGTASPVKKLQVSDSATGLMTNLLLTNTHDINGDTAGIAFSMTDNDLYNKAGIVFERTGNSGVGSLHLCNNNTVDSSNFTLADAALTIIPDGKVGIGTTSPSYSLDVNIASSRARFKAATGDANIELSCIAGSDWLIRSMQNGDFAIYDEDATSNRFIINSSGNATFTGEITSGDDININNGKLVVNHTSAEVRIKSSSDSGESYINFSDPSDINPGQIYYGHSSNAMVFRTNDAERMRLTSGGNLLFGITDEASQPTNKNFFIADFQSGASVTVGGHGGTHTAVTFRHNGATTPGTIVITTNTTTYNTSSDYRLKEDLQDFNGLDKVSKIPVYDFKWKSDESRSYGVMAHELEEVLPQAVNGEKDAEEMQSVDYSKIVPLLVKSIQELKAEVDLLKKECKCK